MAEKERFELSKRFCRLRDFQSRALDQLRDFIERRGAWLDAHIEDLRQFSHESAVKMQNH